MREANASESCFGKVSHLVIHADRIRISTGDNHDGYSICIE